MEEKFDQPDTMPESSQDILSKLGLTKDQVLRNAARGFGLAFNFLYTKGLNAMSGGDIDTVIKEQTAGEESYDDYHSDVKLVGEMLFLTTFNVLSTLYLTDTSEEEFSDVVETELLSAVEREFLSEEEKEQIFSSEDSDEERPAPPTL